MLRVVADTNIYISALNFGGTADEVLALGRAGFRILECALAAGAEAIVTGDQHLLKLKRFRGVAITSPRDFLDAETRR